MKTQAKLESALSKITTEAPKAEVTNAKFRYESNWYRGTYSKGWWLECHCQGDYVDRFLGHNGTEAESYILGQFRDEMKHIHNLTPDPVTFQMSLRAESKEALQEAIKHARLAFTILSMNEPHFANQHWCVGIKAMVQAVQS